MKLSHQKAYRVIVVLFNFALVQICIQFAPAQQPPQFIARLTATRNGQPILVNGKSTPVGSAITPGSIIETGADQSATINLDIGTLEVGQNTSLRLDFEEGRVKVVLTRGCSILKTKKGHEGEIATQKKSISKTNKEKVDETVVCLIDGNVTQGRAARSLMVSVQSPGTRSGGLGAGAWWAIGGGIIAAIKSQGQPILVNGNPTPVGTTINRGSIIQTGADQSATINIKNGVLEVGQNTSLRLDFEEGKVKVTLTRGCSILKAKKGHEGEIATQERSITKTDKEKDGEMAVCLMDGKVTQGSAAKSLMR